MLWMQHDLNFTKTGQLCWIFNFLLGLIKYIQGLNSIQFALQYPIYLPLHFIELVRYQLLAVLTSIWYRLYNVYRVDMQPPWCSVYLLSSRTVRESWEAVSFTSQVLWSHILTFNLSKTFNSSWFHLSIFKTENTAKCK